MTLSGLKQKTAPPVHPELVTATDVCAADAVDTPTTRGRATAMKIMSTFRMAVSTKHTAARFKKNLRHRVIHPASTLVGHG